MIKQASKTIYFELINGKFINKQVYLDGQLQSNPLYDEIIMNLDAYSEHYDLMGFILSNCGDAFILREEINDRYRDTPALKVQALLLIISKFCSMIGTRVEALLNYKVGLKRANIDAIGVFDEVIDILKACDMKSSLSSEIDNNLVNRGIAFWNQIDGLVLSNGGIAIFNQMFGESESLTVHEKS